MSDEPTPSPTPEDRLTLSDVERVIESRLADIRKSHDADSAENKAKVIKLEAALERIQNERGRTFSKRMFDSWSDFIAWVSE